MGTKFTYRCNGCGYLVTTSGGNDSGMLAVTDTFICRRCNNIVDVCIGEYGTIYTRAEAPQKMEGPDPRLTFFTCPECGSEEDLEEWDTKRKPCPRCDGRMRKSGKGLVMLWD